PVVVTRVGGLIEAVAGYDGAIVASPGDPAALRDALLKVAELRGKQFVDPNSWEYTAARYDELFNAL
ncbi:MAG TPA: glycosyl transferase, partial [Methylomirabilota bacterium]|nr:glycosyl transferase [Methylomirabilota bacterium]